MLLPFFLSFLQISLYFSLFSLLLLLILHVFFVFISFVTSAIPHSYLIHSISVIVLLSSLFTLSLLLRSFTSENVFSYFNYINTIYHTKQQSKVHKIYHKTLHTHTSQRITSIKWKRQKKRYKKKSLENK